jgi:hypothetical protein
MSQSRSEQSLCSVLSIERPLPASTRSRDAPSRSGSSNGSSGSGSSVSDEGDETESDEEEEDDDDSEGDVASRLKHFLCNFCCCICAGIASCCSCCRCRRKSEASARTKESSSAEQTEAVHQQELPRWRNCPSFTATPKCSCSLTEIVNKLIRVRQYVRDSLEFAEYGEFNLKLFYFSFYIFRGCILSHL